MKLSPSWILFPGLSQKPKQFLPPIKGPAGLKVLPSKINRPYSYNYNEKFIETQDGSISTITNRCEGLWGGEADKDSFQGACQRGSGGDKTPQDPGYVTMSPVYLSLDLSKSPPLRRRQVSVICQDDTYLIIMLKIVFTVFSDCKKAGHQEFHPFGGRCET